MKILHDDVPLWLSHVDDFIPNEHCFLQFLWLFTGVIWKRYPLALLVIRRFSRFSWRDFDAHVRIDIANMFWLFCMLAFLDPCYFIHTYTIFSICLVVQSEQQFNCSTYSCCLGKTHPGHVLMVLVMRPKSGFHQLGTRDRSDRPVILVVFLVKRCWTMFDKWLPASGSSLLCHHIEPMMFQRNFWILQWLHETHWDIENRGMTHLEQLRRRVATVLLRMLSQKNCALVLGLLAVSVEFRWFIFRSRFG